MSRRFKKDNIIGIPTCLLSMWTPGLNVDLLCYSYFKIMSNGNIEVQTHLDERQDIDVNKIIVCSIKGITCLFFLVTRSSIWYKWGTETHEDSVIMV